MSDTYISNKDGGRVSPATEDKQLEMLTELAKSTEINSANFGTQKITLDGSGLGVGANQICRECWVSHTEGDAIHMAIKNSGDASDADFIIPEKTVIKVPVRNTSQLRFYSAAADKKIYLMWRD